ncbi:ABC transporter ATP-binding protein [Capsulimonas corticalis]|uniref:ABC transporter ATP-binding protein n=1 Tax=Capsulimonas corticalis TaxID=2219043 RepID=A0A402CSW3_9BACT|nr:ABC transporter ATP-binding protein [Capsulimonas corticalis]BDI30941.1 ABC transporter ATP-binding protein [Capsulimonas corticalis]
MKTQNFRRWLSYALRHRSLLIASLIALILGMGVDVLLPRSVGFVVDRVLASHALTSGQVSIPLFGSLSIAHALWTVLGVLCAALVVRAVTGYYTRMWLSIVGERVHLDLRRDLFVHLNRLPISYFDNNYTGMIMARITTDADALWHLVYEGAFQVVAPALTIVAVLIVLFATHAKLTMFALMSVPLIAFMYARMRTHARIVSEAQRDAVATVFSRLQERITGMRLIRVLGQIETESDTFTQDLRTLYEHNVEAMRAWSMLGVQSQFITSATTAAILCVGGLAVVSKTLTVGELVTFYLYAGMLFGPIIQLTQSANIFTSADVAIDRIFSLLATPISKEFAGKKESCPRITGAVDVRDLSFEYNAGHPILPKLSFFVPAGQKVALVGPSGAGKTTLVNLICQFYQPSAGHIFVDGMAIDSLEIESYRRQIGYMSQESFLFSGTITDNLRFAKPSATQDEMENAARKANAHDFIMRLPNGYETQIGERGVMLSGGQKQRLNIARLLIRDAAILILDEPTSALDSESEALILEALDTVFADKTCFIIAHRLSTVVSADRILVFEHGKIVQDGNHHSLTEVPGMYQNLWKKQFVGFGGGSERESAALASAPHCE